MKNYLKLKNICLTACIVFAFASVTAAQQLKPTEIIYSRQPANLNAPPTGANSPTIWAVGQDGANDRQIALGAQPRISDDGRFLLFKRGYGIRYDPYGQYNQYWVRELATGQETQILDIPFNTDSQGAFFSPESNRGDYEIIYDYTFQMLKMNRNGTNSIVLYPFQSGYELDDYPVVRRGDSLIAFQNFLNNAGGGLHTVTINGANRQKIPNTACGDFNPAWSNDGQFVAYGTFFLPCGVGSPNTYPYFISNLSKIKPDGTGKQQITNLTNNDCRDANSNCLTYGMVWSEDNSKIYAAARIGGVAGIYSFKTDGSGAPVRIPITSGNAPDFIGGIVQPRVEQQIASSGGGVATDGNYTLVSTVGEPVAGITSTGGNFKFQSGFWTTELAPTAAGVSIGGRISVGGRGLAKARVSLVDSSGATHSAMTNSFGYYRFDDVAAGETYILSVSSKRYQFAPQVITVVEELNDLNFTAEP